MRARRSEIRSLTGLRGVAALLVVLLHLKNISEPVRFWEVFIEHGYLWVDLFLALSGFILMRSYFLSYGDRTSVSFVAHFLLRRIGRIWPLFVVMACFALVTRQSGLTWFAGPFDNWQLMLFFNLLMVQAWFDYPSIDLPAWSLSGEWACCLALPLLVRFHASRHRWPVIVTYSAAAVILLILATNPFPSRRGALDLALPVTPLPVLRCMASFMMGAVMWRVSTYAPVRRLIASPLVELGLGVTILVLMGWANTDLAVVMLFPPFILCLSFEAGHISRTLASAPFYATGVISYSLYLLQVPLIVLRAQSLSVAWIQRILSLWGVLQGDAGRLVLFYAILFGCSGLTWLLIEQPARKLFHRLSGHAYSA